MKTVNLLPQWYRQQRGQRRTFRVHVAVMLLLSAAMVATWTLGQKRLIAIGDERAAVQSRLAKIPDKQTDLLNKQSELHRLEDLQIAYRELGKTIPMSSVIQQVQNAMTQGMSLAHVQIEVRPDPVKGTGMVGDTKNPPRYHDVAYLSIEGIAPNDRQIDQLVESLARNPLFTDVTLDFTRTGTLETFIVRRFEIKVKMDLERLTTEDPGMKVAEAAHGQ